MKNQIPLHIALENNSSDAAELLISEGANVKIKDNNSYIKMNIYYIKDFTVSQGNLRRRIKHHFIMQQKMI